ncbi:hypothetical protein KEM52_002958 [Ascosphaera acerosa]|nr:hypothetical protein KEM52_002958 [Ascosphaera acerosa]
MSLAAPTPQLDRYVVIHVATTCDEHGVYVTKDTAEVIELGWIVLDAKTCEEHVRSAGTFRDAISQFDAFAQKHLLSRQLEFAFVTLDAWDVRVQLPREARDKGVVLPPYLQHSRTFDLRTEYQRWQQHHPESLPFGPSDLSNICAALEVEPIKSFAPIKHNLPFHLQALAPPSPRRAMDEAITLARVLRGLIRKSQPASEHPDILAVPLDARADVRAFLAERSKILYMSGLPHDTTQSELESWYTQYGGRPIAFLTLQTPDQHKPTGKGFAVFSSHEEAAESLCMNGRALNDKAIEVCPSSSRVLDRAAAVEVLASFPPSKNRPRPGDWTCPSCGFSNFQRRTACFRCSFPAMSAHLQMYGYPYSPMQRHPSHFVYHRSPHVGGHYGQRGLGGGASGGVVPFRAGDWRCGRDGCGYHNFANNVACLRCQAPRAVAAVYPEGAAMTGMASAPSFRPGAYGAQPTAMVPVPPVTTFPHYSGTSQQSPATSRANGFGPNMAGPAFARPTAAQHDLPDMGSSHGNPLIGDANPPTFAITPAPIYNPGAYVGFGPTASDMASAPGTQPPSFLRLNQPALPLPGSPFSALTPTQAPQLGLASGMGTSQGSVPTAQQGGTIGVPLAVGSNPAATLGSQQNPYGSLAALTGSCTAPLSSTTAPVSGNGAMSNVSVSSPDNATATASISAGRGLPAAAAQPGPQPRAPFEHVAAQAAFNAAPAPSEYIPSAPGRVFRQSAMSKLGVGPDDTDPFGFLNRDFSALNIDATAQRNPHIGSTASSAKP